MTTRRALLAAGGAGAAALLAGCGADAERPASDAALLGGVLAVERALVRAYGSVPGRLGRELGARASGLAARLQSAAGLPEDAAPPDGDPLEAALALERRCMAAALPAIGFAREPAHRDLAAEAMAASATHAAILLDRLGRDPLATAFPDGRA